MSSSMTIEESDSTGISPRIRRIFPYPVKKGKNPVPPGKNPVKYTRFPPQYSAPKRHFSLFLRMYLCRNTHVPSPPPLARPGPTPASTGPSLPGPTSRPAPAQRSGTCDRIFPGSVPFFPSSEETMGKSVAITKGRKLAY